MKLTKEQIKEIRRLKEEGVRIKDVAKKMNLPRSTIEYHYSDKRREGAIKYQKEYQKKNPPKRGDKYRKYQRKYQKDRYDKLKEKIENG